MHTHIDTKEVYESMEAEQRLLFQHGNTPPAAPQASPDAIPPHQPEKKDAPPQIESPQGAPDGAKKAQGDTEAKAENLRTLFAKDQRNETALRSAIGAGTAAGMAANINAGPGMAVAGAVGAEVAAETVLAGMKKPETADPKPPEAAVKPPEENVIYAKLMTEAKAMLEKAARLLRAGKSEEANKLYSDLQDKNEREDIKSKLSPEEIDRGKAEFEAHMALLGMDRKNYKFILKELKPEDYSTHGKYLEAAMNQALEDLKGENLDPVKAFAAVMRLLGAGSEYIKRAMNGTLDDATKKSPEPGSTQPGQKMTPEGQPGAPKDAKTAAEERVKKELQRGNSETLSAPGAAPAENAGVAPARAPEKQDRPKNAAELLKRKQERIKEVDRQIDTLDKEIDGLQDERHALDKQVRDLEQATPDIKEGAERTIHLEKINRLKAQIQAIDRSESTLKTEHSKLVREKTHLGEDIDAIGRLREKGEAALKILNEKIRVILTNLQKNPEANRQVTAFFGGMTFEIGEDLTPQLVLSEQALGALKEIGGTNVTVTEQGIVIGTITMPITKTEKGYVLSLTNVQELMLHLPIGASGELQTGKSETGVEGEKTPPKEQRERRWETVEEAKTRLLIEARKDGESFREHLLRQSVSKNLRGGQNPEASKAIQRLVDNINQGLEKFGGERGDPYRMADAVKIAITKFQDIAEKHKLTSYGKNIDLAEFIAEDPKNRQEKKTA